MVYSIGQFAFISLTGEVEPLKEEIEIVRRPGVDGVGLWKTGSRGRPHTLVSGVDVADVWTARYLYSLYRTLIGANPVPMVWQGWSSQQDSFNVVVLDVRIQRDGIFALLNSTPGLNANPAYAWLNCEWDLVAITT